MLFIGADATYDVVVDVPAPVRADQPVINAPGSSGVLGIPDTTGMRFTESPSATPPSTVPSTFFRFAGAVDEKMSADSPLASRLYRMFTKGQR